MELTMQTVSLARVLSGNPFADHPQLRTIWEDRGWADHVEADTLSDLAKGDADPASNRVFLVCDQSGAVVGITGFYLLPKRQIGLRWHGIVPEWRGRGYSKLAFLQVCRIARETTNALDVAEYVEMADPKAESLIDHFKALGFKTYREPADCATYPSELALPSGSGNWLEMLASLRPARVVGKFVF